MKTENEKQLSADLKSGKNVTIISYDKKRCKKFLKEHKVLLDGAVALTGIVTYMQHGEGQAKHLLCIDYLDANKTNLKGFDIPTENTIVEYLEANPEDYSTIVNLIIGDIGDAIKEQLNVDAEFYNLKMKVFERKLDGEKES